MDWLYLENKDTGGSTTVPDEPGVREWHEAHGWKVAELPDEKPFVPTVTESNTDSPANWVILEHPGLQGVSHAFPRNPEALEGAFEAGWRFPPDPDVPADTELKASKAEHKPAKKSSAAPVADDTEKENV